MFGQCAQRVVQACSLPARPLVSSANRKLVMVRPAMLTVSSCSSSSSDILLSRKMLKSVGDNMHPLRTPNVLWNHYPILPLMKTALVALLSHDRP